MKQLHIVLACFASLCVPAIAQTSANRMTKPDSDWAMKAAQGGMAEVKLGQLATERGSNQAVKDFGQNMVNDHSKANDQLKELCQSKGITLPTGLSAKDQAIYQKLSSLSGMDFDKAYVSDMITDHKGDIAEFQKEAGKGQDAELKNFASTTLPTLQHHLQMAMGAQKQLKKSQ